MEQEAVLRTHSEHVTPIHLAASYKPWSANSVSLGASNAPVMTSSEGMARIAILLQENGANLDAQDSAGSTIVVGAEKRKKYLVAAKTCKKGMYECIVYRDHSSCTCPCYRYNSICKHSLCVSEIEGILKEHLDYLPSHHGARFHPKVVLVEPAKRRTRRELWNAPTPSG
ncbi:Ankyrin repeat and FYVE domain-containing protein 1 [Desmophyllum pertusum]|uniref:Ankyrin repeat and FYVE domain-containing protein 1 n=1 Tax=Desmophyllum pertusum TaxID=174260 RepID=A0A9W9Z665_9CNID|nr:Ankyrin repeat and FYVE domain-containing protein 1 [Desmophyllum pertusum]